MSGFDKMESKRIRLGRLSEGSKEGSLNITF